MQFRDAIDIAKEAGDFDKDLSFCNFPLGCCGDASDLLAQFLLENDIGTYSICGTYREGSFEDYLTHAWLLTENRIIIDITGDQFKYRWDSLHYEKSVYVGAGDAFHRLFDIEDRDIHKNDGLEALGSMCQPRLNELYRKIFKYI